MQLVLKDVAVVFVINTQLSMVGFDPVISRTAVGFVTTGPVLSYNSVWSVVCSCSSLSAYNRSLTIY